jgi:Ni,Fe-hydrogenase III large subunit
MNSLQVQNSQSFLIDEIPLMRSDDFQDSVIEGLSLGYRMLGLYPDNKSNPTKIITILADNNSSALHVISGDFSAKPEFNSFANQFPQTNYFECELAENYGYVPINHPWLRPVRKQKVILKDKPYQFYKLEGDEVHEVAVGPIHAGVIEPGHFRFQCHGELVYYLEINLGYQHRGVENMMLESNPNQRIILSESIAGDTVIGHTYAHCQAIEGLAKAQISLRSQVIRSIAEELERIAMHLAGLGGIANDIGFAIVSSSYGRIRTLVINTLAAICGSRFGRGLFIYGGVRFEFTYDVIQDLINKLSLVRKDVSSINETLFSSTGASMRFENTGSISKDFAKQVGLVGLTARACGIELDTRLMNPYGAYHYFPISISTLSTGDVFARARLRSLEIEESLNYIFELIENLPAGMIKTDINYTKPNSMIVSIVEGWRGEIIHSAITDEIGNIVQYKIKDPSFNNWYGLGLALQGTPISDFPLCNKSFDLSYSGHDL